MDNKLFEPENEVGVIVRFVQECPNAIVSIQYKFPDAVIVNPDTGEKFTAEFEYKASNFILHGHDIRECDVIICWENDLPGTVLPIIALNTEWEMVTKDGLPSKLQRDEEYWRIRAQKAEKRLKAQSSKKKPKSGKIRYSDFVYALESGELRLSMTGNEIGSWASKSPETGRLWKRVYRQGNDDF